MLTNELKGLYVLQNVEVPSDDSLFQCYEDTSEDNVIYLNDEIGFFNELFRIRDGGRRYYHYTSFNALTEILKSKRVRFSSPAGLNDITEIFSRSTIFDEEEPEPFTPARMEFINNRLIFSLTDSYDNLNQWRLYGADGTGVCVGFDINSVINRRNILFGKILYGSTVRDSLRKIRQRIREEFDRRIDFRFFSIWGYFLKESEYDYESEYRMIYVNDPSCGSAARESWRINNFGVFYPYVDVGMDELDISLESILLGPKLKEKDLNRGMLYAFLRRYFGPNDINIELSSIRSYR